MPYCCQHRWVPLMEAFSNLQPEKWALLSQGPMNVQKFPLFVLQGKHQTLPGRGEDLELFSARETSPPGDSEEALLLTCVLSIPLWVWGSVWRVCCLVGKKKTKPALALFIEPDQSPWNITEFYRENRSAAWKKFEYCIHFEATKRLYFTFHNSKVLLFILQIHIDWMKGKLLKILFFHHFLFDLRTITACLIHSVYFSTLDSIHIGDCEISQGYQQNPALEDASLTKGEKQSVLRYLIWFSQCTFKDF